MRRPLWFSFSIPSLDIFDTTANNILDLGHTCVVRRPWALCYDDGLIPPELGGLKEDESFNVV